MNLYPWKFFEQWFLFLSNGNVQNFDEAGLKKFYNKNEKLGAHLPQPQEATVIGNTVLHEPSGLTVSKLSHAWLSKKLEHPNGHKARLIQALPFKRNTLKIKKKVTLRSF